MGNQFLTYKEETKVFPMKNRIIVVLLILSIFQLSFAAASATKKKRSGKKRIKIGQRARPKRIRRGFHTIPVFGTDSLKYYYTHLYIGPKREPTSVIIDTGSDYLAFPCKTCGKKCGKHKFAPFDVLHSNTAKKVKCGSKIGKFSCNKCDKDKKWCTFGRSYLEGSSLGGNVWSDYVSILSEPERQVKENLVKMRKINGTTNKKTVAHPDDYKGIRGLFGCTNYETGLFSTQLANGIMGLGPKTVSATTSPNFLDFMFKAHKVNSRNFSICLGNNGGYLTFGGYNAAKHLKGEPIQTVKYTRNYVIKFNGPGADKPVPNAKKLKYKAIVDSGTTFTYLQPKLWRTTKGHFEKWCKETKTPAGAKGKTCNGMLKLNNDYCPVYDPKKHGERDQFFNLFPKLYFSLAKGAQIIWFPKDYLYKKDYKLKDGKEKWCISFNKENMGMNNYSTMGALFMRHYDVYFNRTNKTLSFVRSECEDKNEASYPVRGIKLLVRRARILLGAMLSSKTGIAMVLILMLILLGFSAYRFGLMKKFIGQAHAENELAKVDEKVVAPTEEVPQTLEEEMVKAE